MQERLQTSSYVQVRSLLALTLVGIFFFSFVNETRAYKIEVDLSAPVGSESVIEENGRTEIELDLGLVSGSSCETGSVFARANLATGRLELKVAPTIPEDSPHTGGGLASININDHLTFTLAPSLPSADIQFSMTVDGSPTCESLSSNCFTNAIISLGGVSDQALGLPLPNPKVLGGTVTVVDGQVLRLEAFLSGRAAVNNVIDVSNPGATIRLTLPEGVSFTSESGVFLSQQQPLPPGAPVSSDLNGDGKADIVWRNAKTGGVAVWLMNGGTVASSDFLDYVSLDWQIVGLGDVDNDSKADIIWRHTKSGGVAIWLMNGLTIASVGLPGSASTEWVIKGVGDMDGNGTADIIWRHTVTGSVAVWLMNGGTIVSPSLLAGVDLNWEIVGVGDVDDDGKADVVWRNTTSGAVAVWLMNGLTIASVGVPGGASMDWEIAGLGDVDGNGMADIVWRKTGGGLAVWLMNGEKIEEVGSLNDLPTEWHIARVGDTDGDGKADVIWHNRNTGQVVVWLMNGLTTGLNGFPGRM